MAGTAAAGETRLTFNYARALMRKVASYVFPAPVTFTVPGRRGEDATANRAERALAEAIAELDLARLDVELCVDGGGAGRRGGQGDVGRGGGAAGRGAGRPGDAGRATWAPDDPRRAAGGQPGLRAAGGGGSRG